MFSNNFRLTKVSFIHNFITPVPPLRQPLLPPTADAATFSQSYIRELKYFSQISTAKSGMELEKKKARESYLNFGFLTKKQYEPPSWASNLCPIPSHVYSLGHFPTPIHKWNLPNLPKNTEVWLKECNEVETRSGNLNFCWLMLWHREQTAYNYWRFPK